MTTAQSATLGNIFSKKANVAANWVKAQMTKAAGDTKINGLKPQVNPLVRKKKAKADKADYDAEVQNTPDKFLLSYDYTDDDNAARLVAAYGNRIAYCEDEGTWYVFNGRYWEKDTKKLRMDAIAKELHGRIKAACNDLDDEATLKKARRLGNNGAKTSMFAAAESLANVTKEQFNKNHDKLIVANGVVDLRTGELSETFSPDLYMTQAITNVGYNPDADEPKRFMQFLKEIFNDDAEIIEYVSMVLGYLITGETRDRKFFICYGSGSNGKSVLFNLLRKLFGTNAASMAPSGVLEKKRSDSLNSDIMRVKDVRLVTIDELQKNDKLNTGLVKVISGGPDEQLNSRDTYGKCEEFYFELKLVFNTNFLPQINWFDSAIESRVVVIPFNVVIPDDKKDLELSSKLWQEREGILKYIVQYAAKYYKEGLPAKPAAVEKAYTKNLVTDCPIKAFFAEEVDITSNASDKLQADKAYKAFVKWCKAHGLCGDEITNQTLFGKQIRLISGIEVKQDSYHHTNYFGVKLKSKEANGAA